MKVAVIGTGFGGRVVAPIYRDLGFDVDLVSARDTDGVRRAIAAPVDLVSIHSPPFLHLEHVMLALDHQRAVLCEKPLGLNAGEARAMRDRARSLGVLHFTNYEFRRHPARVALKTVLDAGTIGDVQHISWTFIGSAWRQRPYGWLFDAARGGGWIGAYGSHAVDTLRWLLDSEVADCGGVIRTEIVARTDAAGAEHRATADDAMTSWYVFANGTSVSFDTAFATTVALPNRMILLGRDGAIEFVDDRSLTIRRPGVEDEVITFPPPPGDLHEPALIPWLTDVRDALAAGRQIAPSFDDGVTVAETLDRLKQTCRAGRQ